MSEAQIEDPNPELVRLILDAIEDRLLDLHTGLPAKVLVFDPATNSVDVQPLLLRARRDEDGVLTTFPLPVISRVPIEYPCGGGWSITWPLSVGDTVDLAFCERSLDRWKEAPPGDLVDPASTRKHDLSDAIAKPCLRPRTAPIPNVSPTNLRIANDAGTVVVELGPNVVNVTAPTVNINAGLAATLRSILGEPLIEWLRAHTHVGAPSGPLPVTPAQTAPGILEALLANTKIS